MIGDPMEPEQAIIEALFILQRVSVLGADAADYAGALRKLEQAYAVLTLGKPSPSPSDTSSGKEDVVSPDLVK